jgi:hypothetical protein
MMIKANEPLLLSAMVITARQSITSCAQQEAKQASIRRGMRTMMLATSSRRGQLACVRASGAMGTRLGGMGGAWIKGVI